MSWPAGAVVLPTVLLVEDIPEVLEMAPRLLPACMLGMGAVEEAFLAEAEAEP